MKKKDYTTVNVSIVDFDEKDVVRASDPLASDSADNDRDFWFGTEEGF